MKYRGTVFFFAGFLATLGAGWYGFPKALYERAAQPFSFSHKTHTGEKVGRHLPLAVADAIEEAARTGVHEQALLDVDADDKTR